MTRELIENIRAIIVPYMAHDLRRINYENMGEIDAEQFKEDMNEILDLATKALEQESESTYKYGILHKIAEFFQNWDGDENAKIEISVNDMREIADIFRKKARAERQLKEKALNYNPDEWCKTCSEYNHDKHCCPRYNKVIRTAVEEMKQEPCEYAISRYDALKLVRDCGRCDDKSAYGTIYHGIEHLPPVQPKTGHWIHTSGYNFHCSECDFIQHESKTEYKYCPNCGAKMVETQESEAEE